MPLKLFLGLYIENIEINTKQVSEYPQTTKILKNASSLDHGVATWEELLFNKNTVFEQNTRPILPCAHIVRLNVYVKKIPLIFVPL